MMGNDMEYEWGPWIEHDGKGCPCVGEYVRAEYHSAAWGNVVIDEGIGSNNRGWSDVHPIYGPCVIRYRIRKPLVKKWLQSIEIKEPVDA